MSSFSRNGSPTWTTPRCDSPGSVERGERRAVDAVAAGVGAEEDDRVAGAARRATAVRSSWRMIPTHIALTSGLPS